jgi:hypothetical protein
LRMHEHALAAATSATLLGVSLLGLRFPRLLAWPLAAVGALFGGLGVVRATRSASIEYSGCCWAADRGSRGLSEWARTSEGGSERLELAIV